MAIPGGRTFTPGDGGACHASPFHPVRCVSPARWLATAWHAHPIQPTTTATLGALPAPAVPYINESGAHAGGGPAANLPIADAHPHREVIVGDVFELLRQHLACAT